MGKIVSVQCSVAAATATAPGPGPSGSVSWTPLRPPEDPERSGATRDR